MSATMLNQIYNSQVKGLKEDLVKKYCELTQDQLGQVEKAMSKTFPLVLRDEEALLEKFPDMIWMNEYRGNKDFILDPKSATGELCWRLMPNYLDTPMFREERFVTEPNPNKKFFLEHFKQMVVFTLLLIEVKPHQKSKTKGEDGKWVKGSGGPSLTPYGKATRALGELLGVDFTHKYKVETTDGQKEIVAEECVKKLSEAQREAMEKGRRSGARKGVKKGPSKKVQELEKQVEDTKTLCKALSKQLEEALLVIQKAHLYIGQASEGDPNIQDAMEVLDDYKKSYDIPDWDGPEPSDDEEVGEFPSDEELAAIADETIEGFAKQEVEDNEEFDLPPPVIEADEDCKETQEDMPEPPPDSDDEEEAEIMDHDFVHFASRYTPKKHQTEGIDFTSEKFATRVLVGFWKFKSQGGNFKSDDKITCEQKVAVSKELYKKLNEMVKNMDELKADKEIADAYKKLLTLAGDWKDESVWNVENQIWIDEE